MRKQQISVIGGGGYDNTTPQYKMSELIGEKLIDLGYRVITGGLGGVMEGALKGAKLSKAYQSGDTIGIIPGFDPEEANIYADIVIPTGLDVYRNTIVSNSDAIIVVGGGAGTLVEAASAWSLKRPILVLEEVEGVVSQLKILKFDERQHYKFDNKVIYFKDISSLEVLLEENILKYNKRHKSIRRKK